MTNCIIICKCAFIISPHPSARSSHPPSPEGEGLIITTALPHKLVPLVKEDSLKLLQEYFYNNCGKRIPPSRQSRPTRTLLSLRDISPDRGITLTREANILTKVLFWLSPRGKLSAQLTDEGLATNSVIIHQNTAKTQSNAFRTLYIFGVPEMPWHFFWGKGETNAVLFVICKANYIGTKFVSTRG